jgi:ribosomal protein S1
VSGVHNCGVFVHLDGEPQGLCTGFIRVPDLTWSWIDHPSDAVGEGQRVRLAPGIEGFLHVSEMTDSSVVSPGQLVSEGDQMPLRVAETDLQRHRVRLGTPDS